MFHSSSMLDDDETTKEVVRTFVEKVFKTFGAEESGKISFEDVMKYMKTKGQREDVWDVFGRSMLQDFTARPRN
jgi:Ca2+-binding EF-hand superfamily protein